MMEYPQDFKDYITKTFELARNLVFGAGEYRVTFRWEEEPHYEDDDNCACSMSCYVNSVYMYSSIVIYPDSYELYKEGDFDTIARNCLHEICHIVMQPMADLLLEDARPSQEKHYRDVVEVAVERMSKSIHVAAGEWWNKEA